MSDKNVIAELHRIAAEHGGVLNPVDVVAAARSEDSPLHEKFTWDDSAAAEKHRLWEARMLISVTVEYVGDGDNAVNTRVFVSLSSDRDRGGYRNVSVVLADPSLRAQMVRDAFAEMKRFRQKYSDLKELCDVFDAMQTAEKKIA